MAPSTSASSHGVLVDDVDDMGEDEADAWEIDSSEDEGCTRDMTREEWLQLEREERSFTGVPVTRPP